MNTGKHHVETVFQKSRDPLRHAGKEDRRGAVRPLCGTQAVPHNAFPERIIGQQIHKVVAFIAFGKKHLLPLVDPGRRKKIGIHQRFVKYFIPVLTPSFKQRLPYLHTCHTAGYFSHTGIEDQGNITQFPVNRILQIRLIPVHIQKTYKKFSSYLPIIPKITYPLDKAVIIQSFHPAHDLSNQFFHRPSTLIKLIKISDMQGAYFAQFLILIVFQDHPVPGSWRKFLLFFKINAVFRITGGLQKPAPKLLHKFHIRF